MRRLTLLLLLVSAVAAAQTSPPQLDLETLYLDPGGRGSLTVGSGQTLPSGKFRLGLGLGYTYGHLSTSTATTEGNIILRDRVTAQIPFAIGITDWLEVGATLPVILAQFTAANPPFTVATAGLGTPYVHLKFGILGENRPFFLSLGLSAGLPLGTGGALSNQGFSVVPRLNLGKRFSSFTLSGEVSALIRSVQTGLSAYGGSYWDYVGNNLFVSLAATTSGETARGELSVRFIAPLQERGWIGIEGLLGLRINIKILELFLALGPGFGGHPNTPGFRVYLGAAVSNASYKPKPTCVEGEPYVLAECPDLDLDHDTIKNGVDKCPSEAEDKDGFQDTDGCPDKDNDKDGVADAADKCRDVAGLVENEGCPDTDTDGDQVVDRLDRCPADAEDLDGFQDDDGCVDPDNDGDGLTDQIDACINEPGILEEKGCPAKDDDGDTVWNHVDNCPTEKGDPANYGCPIKEKQLVVIESERIKLLEVVQFATGKATILPASNKLLTQVANVLNAQKRIRLVQIEGHSDNVGKPEKNQKLSQDRANSVKAFLVKKGIAESRLKAVGFGQDKPIESNASAKGREANRRVELNIIEKD